MHRPLLSAGFVLLLASVPLSAQHGGGHASAGGHGGFASHGGFAGHSSGHTFSAPRSGSGFAAHPSARGYSSRPAISSRGFNRGFGHSGVGVRIRSYGFTNNCNRYGCLGYGYPYGGFYDPYWWWDSYSSYDADDARERAEASQMNADNLDEQRSLREQDEDAYARPTGRPRAQAQVNERADADPATVLVFRDQHKREIHNYAIVGQMLWSFGAQRTEKIPLASLDLPATEKANDERGVEFRVPRVSEGQ